MKLDNLIDYNLIVNTECQVFLLFGKFSFRVDSCTGILVKQLVETRLVSLVWHDIFVLLEMVSSFSLQITSIQLVCYNLAS